MSTGSVEEAKRELTLYYIDIGKLVETMAQRLEGQGITVSQFAPLNPKWYQKFLAGYGGRITKEIGRTISESGEYELTHIVDAYALNRKKKFGRIRIEKGLLDITDADYERFTLDTFRPIRPRGRDIFIQPTRVDICILGFDEEYATGYDMTRNDKHPQVSRLLPTEWFLKPDALQYLKENGKLK